MNIFFLDEDPTRAAKLHNDAHCNKMILESAQLLCTACHKNGVDAEYDPIFENNPCTLWVEESKANFEWVARLATALNEEMKYRLDKTEDHKSARVIWRLRVPDLPERGLTRPYLAMPEHCERENPVEAYREYYRTEKRHLAEWTGRPTPSFMNSSQENGNDGGGRPV